MHSQAKQGKAIGISASPKPIKCISEMQGVRSLPATLQQSWLSGKRWQGSCLTKRIYHASLREGSRLPCSAVSSVLASLTSATVQVRSQASARPPFLPSHPPKAWAFCFLQDREQPLHLPLLLPAPWLKQDWFRDLSFMELEGERLFLAGAKVQLLAGGVKGSGRGGKGQGLLLASVLPPGL